jgi:lipopolysaccharide transport system permease protein
LKIQDKLDGKGAQRMMDRNEMVIEPRGKFGLNLGELWQYRELFYFFTLRDVKVKYKQTFLGVLWVVLQPLMMIAVFTFVFRRALQISSVEMDYTLFAFSGLLLWNLFASSVNNAGSSMLTNAPIIKKIYFPRLIIPFSGILVSLVDFSVSLVVFVIFLLFKSTPVDFIDLLWCWPSAVLLAVVGTLGLGAWLSALSVKYRDFRFIVPFIIQFGFFVTPVAYPVTVLNPWMKFVVALNPVYGAIQLFRIPLSSSSPDASLIGVSILSAVVVTVIGLTYFRRTESFFADLA